MKIRFAGRIAAACFVSLAASAAAHAQDADTAAAPVAEVAPVASEEALPAPALPVIPKLTVVFLEMMDEVSSATAQPGDTFRLKLVSPIAVGDRVVVQAGADAIGEVVHAKKKGGSGAGGELILAARYIEMPDGRQLPLRSMQMIGNGTSEDGKVQMMTGLVGVFGLMVKGHDTIIVPGRTAQAKVREDFPIDPPVAEATVDTAASNEPISDSSTDGGVGAAGDEVTQGVN